MSDKGQHCTDTGTDTGTGSRTSAKKGSETGTQPGNLSLDCITYDVCQNLHLV